MKKIIRFAVCTLLIAALLTANLCVASAVGKFFAKAEMVPILSHIEEDCGLDEYATVQGACSDGKYAYFTVMKGGVATLAKYDIKTWRFIESKKVSNIGHGNDMTYNSAKGYIAAANNAPYYNIVTLIDPDTLQAIRDVELELDIYSIAYNAARGVYVVGISGGYDFALLDENFEEIGEEPFEGASTGYTRQGCDCDDDYIYFVQSGGRNLITVYDYDGDHVASIPLTNTDEAENIFHIGSTYYVTLHYYGNFVYRVGFSSSTQIGYTVSFDANGGEGKMDAQFIHYGDKTALKSCGYTKDGYVFKGWRVQRDCDGRYRGYRTASDEPEWLDEEDVCEYLLYDDEEKIGTTVRFGGLKLSAFWINERYGIDFGCEEGGVGEMEPVSAAYEEKIALPECGFSMEGYVFDGYVASRDVDGRIYGYPEGSDKAVWLKPDEVKQAYRFMPGDEVSALTYDGRVTLTARFKFAYTFDEDGTTLVEYFGVDEKVSIPSNSGELKTLAEGAIKDNDVMTELYIPAGVNSLQKEAVTNCPKLKKLVFEGSLPEDFDAYSVSGADSPAVYKVRDGQIFCIGFFADNSSAALIRCHAASLDDDFKANLYTR